MSPSTLKQNMTKSLVSVRWDCSMQEAARLMQEKNIRHLPVVDQEGNLSGILSDRDVKRAMDPHFPGFAKGTVAGDFMNWPVVSVEQNTPLAKAVKMMWEEKISALLVTRGGAVVGIITSEDMLRVLYDLLLHEGKDGKLGILDFTYDPIYREMVRTAGSVGI
jgi:CBS domain-containing protein